MEYSLKLHGDSLEKHATTFVSCFLNNYEEIWKMYIGNKGNQTKATISKYSDDEKRQKFWENCYTVLESSFLSYNIATSEIFSNPINTFSDYEIFNKNFLAFFAHIGRINDNIVQASEVLGIYNNKPRLKEFYSARHIAIHGKVIPITQDEFGIVKLPIFYTSETTSFGWTVNSHSWNQGNEMEHQYVGDTCEKYILDLLVVLNGILGEFLQLISNKLKILDAKIIFEYKSVESQGDLAGSGGLGGNITPINVYNIQFPVSQSRNGNK
jgi:L-rhamnose mutarotase